MVSRLRRTGIDLLGRAPWGAHICVFYDSKDDLLDAVVPFISAGLEDNEFCLWAVSAPLTEEDARNALRRAVPAFDAHLARGSLEILAGQEWYLKGDEFDLERIVSGWHDKLTLAQARGYDGVRASGNAFWLDTKHWNDFRDYESELTQALAGLPMLLLCTYPLPASRAADVLDIAHAHQRALARRRGGWETIELGAAQTEIDPLTPREIEVLTWAARGKTAWEIGEILGIAKRTVDEHTQSASRKLGAANRTQAVAIALREGVIKP